MSEKVPPYHPTRQLPPQPSLEQLRKQAKELLERYGADDPAAIAEVRQFERKPDASFALSDAQRVLARSYGYASWPKLKAFVDGANILKLTDAVKAGDMPRVRSLLHARPELIGMDVSGGDEHRALHFAVLRRDAAMVRLLMEAGADARKGIYPHRDATSALAIARDRGYDDIVQTIEEEERLRREEMSCPNATVSPLQDQISAAIESGDEATAKRLLDSNRTLIHACDRDGATPLHVAAEEANDELVAWLLERRADIRKRDVKGLTALDRAALAADPRNHTAEAFLLVAQRLLAHGAEKTIHAAVALADAARVGDLIQANPGLLRQMGNGGGLLTLAVKHGHVEMARLLLDLGADVDERIMLKELEQPTLSWGFPLWWAALAGSLAMTRLLLDRGADPNANVYASGWPLLNAWRHKDESVKNLLLARGAKPQPYMVAEMHDVAWAKRLLETDGSEEVASELAWSGADHGCAAIVELALPHLKWARGDQRWHWVMIQPIRGAGANTDNEGYFQCMAALLRHGIDPNVSRFGANILHYASARHGACSGADRARFACMLLDHGASFDTRDDLLKSTPLGWACRWGHKEVAELLIGRAHPLMSRTRRLGQRRERGPRR